MMNGMDLITFAISFPRGIDGTGGRGGSRCDANLSPSKQLNTFANDRRMRVSLDVADELTQC